MAKTKREVHEGEVFTRLTVVSKKVRYQRNTWYHKVLCSCGTEKEVAHSNLVLGKSKSCGCLSREMTSLMASTHGMSKTPEYATWRRMWNRCTNPIVERYPNYGGRGISVCERWGKFENFYADMGPKPSAKHSIGRIDNDGNYEPLNCRWETPEQQRCNTSYSRFIEYDGKKMTVSQCERVIGLSPGIITQRLALGMVPPKLFSPENLGFKPFTVGGVTRGTKEWMAHAKIPISSFYHHQRKGKSPEQVIELYLKKNGIEP